MKPLNLTLFIVAMLAIATFFIFCLSPLFWEGGSSRLIAMITVFLIGRTVIKMIIGAIKSRA